MTALILKTDMNGCMPSPIRDLGEPIIRVLSQVQTFGQGPNGEPQVYFAAQGNAETTAEFAAVNVRSKETIFRVPGNRRCIRQLVMSLRPDKQS